MNFVTQFAGPIVISERDGGIIGLYMVGFLLPIVITNLYIGFKVKSRDDAGESALQSHSRRAFSAKASFVAWIMASMFSSILSAVGSDQTTPTTAVEKYPWLSGLGGLSFMIFALSSAATWFFLIQEFFFFKNSKKIDAKIMESAKGWDLNEAHEDSEKPKTETDES